MTERTMQDAMSALDALLDDIDSICRAAVARYREYPPDVLIELDRRAEASCIYAHMLYDAERRFADRKGIVFRDIRGLKVWIVGEAAVIRFKKMDEDGRTRNYPTKQAKDYDRQRQLPGLPYPPLNLVAGYLLDPTGTTVERVQIARPLGKDVDWCVAIVPPSQWRPESPRWIDVTRERSAF